MQKKIKNVVHFVIHHKKTLFITKRKNEVPPPESNGALDIAMWHINTSEL